jgi:hypothetical protein
VNANEVAERLERDTPFYAKHLLKIADKRGQVIPFEFSRAQIALDRALEEQRAKNYPMRAIILKARQIGFSTAVQGKLIQRCTTRPNYNVVVVAHDRDTGAKLYRIGRRMYDNLPDDPHWKPGLPGQRRGRELHFLNKHNNFPDSVYLVDTAGEFKAGRGGTYQAVHASEAAFWDDLVTKLTALKNAVPDHPESMFIIESTANGHNDFKGLWDDAEEGINDYIPFFWPWWKEEQYSRPFDNDDEKARFRVGDTSQSRFAEGEEELFDPGPIDTMTGKNCPLTLEQLNWRRKTIANESSGKLEQFQQEYPATPQEAFVASARQAFDANLMRGVLIKTRITDPRDPSPDSPGPAVGKLISTNESRRALPTGDEILVPGAAKFVPASDLDTGEQSNWKFWVPPDKPYTDQAVIGVDVSGGQIEVEGSAPAYHAIEVIDHSTREQLAEYRSRIDPGLLAEQIYLACLLFNKPWCAIETTGSWGVGPAMRMWKGYRYPFMYFRQSVGKKMDRQENSLGWDTSVRTKPLLIQHVTDLLREDSHGIKSFGLAMEMSTLVRLPNGKVEPERGKFSDRFMAWAIAQYVAQTTPVKRNFSAPRPDRPRDPITGW